MTWIPWKSMEASQSPRDHWTTSRRSLQPQNKELPSLQVTQNRQRGWKKNANKSSVIDITPPKDYIISTENLLVVGRLEIPFEIVCFQVTWQFSGGGIQVLLSDFNSLQCFGGTKYPWLPVDLLRTTVWPSDNSNTGSKEPPKTPGVFFDVFVLILDLLGHDAWKKVPKIDSFHKMVVISRWWIRYIRWYNP